MNPTSKSSLKNKMPPSGEILYNSSTLNSINEFSQSWQGNNNFLGNTGDTLSREPQTRQLPDPEELLAFGYQERVC